MSTKNDLTKNELKAKMAEILEAIYDQGVADGNAESRERILSSISNAGLNPVKRGPYNKKRPAYRLPDDDDEGVLKQRPFTSVVARVGGRGPDRKNRRRKLGDLPGTVAAIEKMVKDKSLSVIRTSAAYNWTPASGGTTLRALNELVKAGKLERVERGLYHVKGGIRSLQAE